MEDFAALANLLQVSNAFGKPMEEVVVVLWVDRCWDTLVQRYQATDKQLADGDLVSAKFSLHVL